MNTSGIPPADLVGAFSYAAPYREMIVSCCSPLVDSTALLFNGTPADDRFLFGNLVPPGIVTPEALVIHKVECAARATLHAYISAPKLSPRQEQRRLKSIAGHAEKLAALLNPDTDTSLLDELVLGDVELRVLADRARDQLESIAPTWTRDLHRDQLAVHLIEIWVEESGRKATAYRHGPLAKLLRAAIEPVSAYARDVLGVDTAQRLGNTSGAVLQLINQWLNRAAH